MLDHGVTNGWRWALVTSIGTLAICAGVIIGSAWQLNSYAEHLARATVVTEGRVASTVERASGDSVEVDGVNGLGESVRWRFDIHDDAVFTIGEPFEVAWAADDVDQVYPLDQIRTDPTGGLENSIVFAGLVVLLQMPWAVRFMVWSRARRAPALPVRASLYLSYDRRSLLATPWRTWWMCPAEVGSGLPVEPGLPHHRGSTASRRGPTTLHASPAGRP